MEDPLSIADLSLDDFSPQPPADELGTQAELTDLDSLLSNDFAAIDEDSALDNLLDEQPTPAAINEFAGLDNLMQAGSDSEIDNFLDGEPTSGAVDDEFTGLDNVAVEDSGSAIDAFGDLDNLLSEGPSVSDDYLTNLEDVSESATAENGFADLENLLGEDVSSGSPVDSLSAVNQFLQADTTAGPSDVEGFADLEALLQDDVGPTPDIAQSVTTSDDTGFDELDDLLKDAEEKIGGPSSLMATRGIPPQNRRLARPGRVFSEQTMRVPVKHLDNLSNLVGELVVNRNSLEQDQERLRQSLDNLLYQVQQLSDVGQRMQDLYERSLLESSLLASRQSYRQGASNFSREGSTSVQTSSSVEYDPLEMDRFTGFHSLSQEMIELIVRVRESASDIEFIVDETDQVTRMFRQVTTQLQEGLTRSRMVPFAQTADRLPRAVRDIAMKVGKQAELHIEGRETLIDKMILEQLYDPMTHLVNNAITHGIEPPDVRRAAGKSPVGKITIRAFHQGNQTIISFSDDGAGIDVEGVKAKAIEKD